MAKKFASLHTMIIIKPFNNKLSNTNSIQNKLQLPIFNEVCDDSL